MANSFWKWIGAYLIYKHLFGSSKNDDYNNESNSLNSRHHFYYDNLDSDDLDTFTDNSSTYRYDNSDYTNDDLDNDFIDDIDFFD